MQIDEITRGETYGSAVVLMKERHSTTIMAVPGSVLARMLGKVFEELWYRQMQIVQTKIMA